MQLIANKIIYYVNPYISICISFSDVLLDSNPDLDCCLWITIGFGFRFKKIGGDSDSRCPDLGCSDSHITDQRLCHLKPFHDVITYHDKSYDFVTGNHQMLSNVTKYHQDNFKDSTGYFSNKQSSIKVSQRNMVTFSDMSWPAMIFPEVIWFIPFLMIALKVWNLSQWTGFHCAPWRPSKR